MWRQLVQRPRWSSVVAISVRTGADLKGKTKIRGRSISIWLTDTITSFTFLRMVVKLEQAMSIESIKKILRDVKYTGNIDVTVEVEEHETTLLSDHALARIRSSSFWWFLCVVCQLWIVYWLLSKHWDVLTIEWPTKSSQFLTGDQESGDGATAWSEKWRCAIARAALENMRGKLASAETSPGGAAWKALGDFDEVRDWGHGD